MESLVWLVTATALAVGLTGTVVPLLPGTVLIFLGALLHKLFLPGWVSWWTVAILGAGVVGAEVIKWSSGVVGARVFGASKWGVIGAAVGALIGLFFSLPGLLLGPIIGALLGEKLIAKREFTEAAKSGAGVGVGLIVATGAQVVIALGMIGLFLGDCFLW